MKAAAFVLLAATLAALLTPPAAAQDIWQVQQITNTPWSEVVPQVYGDRIYYGDRRNGYGEIYVWDEAQGPRMLIGGDGISRAVRGVYGEKLAVTHYVNSQYDVYTWDPVNAERAISTAPGNQQYARLYGDLVTWEDYRSGVSKVYAWDPVNGERELSADGGAQTRPKVWGDRIVWVQSGTYPSYSDKGVYMWTPEGGVERVGWGDYAAVYEDRVVTWSNAGWVYPDGPGPGEYHIGYLNEWTPETGFHTILQHDESTSLGLETWGDLVVTGAGAWDPVHGFTHYITTGYGITSFSLYGDKIAWASGNYDIFLSTMVPEPSSLLVLLAGIGAGGAALRRGGRGSLCGADAGVGSAKTPSGLVTAV